MRDSVCVCVCVCVCVYIIFDTAVILIKKLESNEKNK